MNICIYRTRYRQKDLPPPQTTLPGVTFFFLTHGPIPILTPTILWELQIGTKPIFSQTNEGYVFTGVCLARGGVRGCQGDAWFGGHTIAGGMCGCWRACVVAGGRDAWLQGGVCGCAHAWLLGGMCGCQGALPGGMHAGRGACVVVGGVHGCRGHAWLWGGGGQLQRDTVNERTVRILLECILVTNVFPSSRNCACMKKPLQNKIYLWFVVSIYELATAYHKKTYHLVSELIQRLTYPTNYLNNYINVSKIFQLHTSHTAKCHLNSKNGTYFLWRLETILRKKRFLNNALLSKCSVSVTHLK